MNESLPAHTRRGFRSEGVPTLAVAGRLVGPPASGSIEAMAQATFGSVRVANEVIASIAALAAREVDGVQDLDHAGARHLMDWLKRQTVHRGVRVALDPERKIHLDVFLTVAAGAPLQEVGARVQANVLEAVERMLGLEVAEVSVFVSSVAF